ncbi:MAG: hypothetical protein ACP5P4_11935 [Steroidobacteraceae bacterium]
MRGKAVGSAAKGAADLAASSRPLSRDLTGRVLEEWQRAVAGAAAIHAKLSGYDLTCGAGHLTRPRVSGQATEMRAALDAAALRPEAIGYINARGSAAPLTDATETTAIKAVI